MIEKVRKTISTYKYTFLFWLIGTILLGQFYAVLAGMVGLVIDYTVNRNTKWKKEKRAYTTSLYWFIGVIPFSMVYTWIVVAFTGQEITNGIIHSIIETSIPFTNKMAEFFPVIDNYTSQILRHGEDWRVGRVRHLYSVVWLVCIMTSPLLFRDLLSASNILFETTFSKNHKLKDYLINIARMYICLLIAGGLMLFSVNWGMNGSEMMTDGSGGSYERIEKYLPISIWTVFISTFAFLLTFLITIKAHLYPIIKFCKHKKQGGK